MSPCKKLTNLCYFYNRRLMPIFYVDSKNYLPREIMGLRIIQILSPERAREIMFCIIRNPIISRGRSFLLSTWKIGINVFISSLPFQRYNKWRSKLMLPAVSHVTDWMCGVGVGGERVRAVGKPTTVNDSNTDLRIISLKYLARNAT